VCLEDAHELARILENSPGSPGPRQTNKLFTKAMLSMLGVFRRCALASTDFRGWIVY
jgi:hypothetical protein